MMHLMRISFIFRVSDVAYSIAVHSVDVDLNCSAFNRADRF